ncbi:transglutaminase family protein [Jatrophihabitans telluris]|uniref:Transglutaminase family protein n=1 Tax=Jatrophihabitans telluris TaxID=2038343 RepID=A0ABY4QYI1_9ACTN|nr:transglutaminase family protein [Jatrophihabitans telluris]UQX88580.1 transglutaminase family protein [Jatrophihabitans telluris]
MIRTVGCSIVVEVQTSARLVLQVGSADLPTKDGVLERTEELAFSLDGRPVEAVSLPAPHGGRWHVLDVDPGRFECQYQARLSGRLPAPSLRPGEDISYLHASRYAESDRLFAFARAEFAGLGRGHELLAAVREFVNGRLYYLSGWSRPTDGAVDTLLAGQGVCRDYAHLVLALLRALDVPARMVAVYAPGLSPMDFHAVAEAAVDGQWWAVDATGLAPRSSLVRIATGLDATDTAFLSSYRGDIRMLEQYVTAYSDGDLPVDDHRGAQALG